MGLVKRFEIWMSLGVMWVGFLGVTSGYKFYVGGRDGWVITPSEDYTHWSHRNRFQVNDTLYFRYKKGSDSVLVVREEDYNTCKTINPITSFTDGDSLFVLRRSGPFFFVSGNSGNCNRGQKLAIVVMSVHHHHHHSPSPSPAPYASSPQHSPTVSPSPALPVPAISPGAIPSDSEAPAPAPAPMSARNSGSVPSVVCSFGLVLVVMISSMV